MPKKYTIPGLVKAISAYFSCSPQDMRKH
jgi:hypothetical protein